MGNQKAASVLVGALVLAATSVANGNLLGKIAPLPISDKTVLAEVLRMKSDLGEDIWPGFGKMDIPVIIYDDDFEYLFGYPDPPAPWEIVAGDDFQGRSYFARPARNPQAFAVRVGERWAGSFSTLSRMNKKIPMKLRPDWYSLGLIHEIFHAFQAESAPDAFSTALSVYALEARYPFDDVDFAAAWDSEGAALSRALKTAGTAEIMEAAGQFLRLRDARRRAALPADDLIDFEKRLEWLEGLGKYAEIRADELAVARSDREAYARYKVGLHFLDRADLTRLEKALGRQKDDLRFYLSGMAIGKILDRLDPGWKKAALGADHDLENLLRITIEKKQL